MNRFLVSTGTITYAIKGRDVLRRNGIRASVERTTSDRLGCGYGISVVGNIKKAERILRESGVKILEIKPYN